MIVDGLETNSTLKTLIAPTLDFKSLILLYEAFATKKGNFYLHTDPHLIDVSVGLFSFRPKDLPNNSWFSFKSLLAILGRLLNHELLPKLDLSPYLVDVEKGAFCFSPQTYFQIFSEQLTALLAFGQSFTLRKLTLNRCQFSDESINALCDLIRLSNSLTSIDFSKCGLTDEYFIQILSALQINSHVNGLHIILELNSIGDVSALALAEAVRGGFPLIKYDLSNTKVTAVGVQAIAEALKG
ncbi:hypothetical protein GEMRC1_003646 [Eukaryota sp. GEM-RC1]